MSKLSSSRKGLLSIVAASIVSLCAVTGPAAYGSVSLAKAPELKSWEGLHELSAVAIRQRMLAERISYTMNVDAAGKPTNCTINRKFRRKAVEIALCRPLLKHMTFSPALDDKGQAVSGTYTGVIDMRTCLGESRGRSAQCRN